MTRSEHDPAFDTLLELDGQILFIDERGHWVKFEVKRAAASPERPHGLKYSLTLHDTAGRRLIGFDNAHPVATSRGPARRSRQALDHRHRSRTVRPYDYRDAATLLADFWAEVDAILKET